MAKPTDIDPKRSGKLPPGKGRSREKTHKPESYAQIVRDSRAAGMTPAEARAHAQKILGARDLFVVDARGRLRLAELGPSSHDRQRKRPTPKGGA
jgi:hypothetical protein